MPIFRWDTDMDRWREDMMRYWNRMTQDFGRAFDSEPDHFLADTGDRLVLEVELPGADPRQVDLDVDQESVTVSGHWPDAPQGFEHIRRQGSFSLQVNLPADVDAERAEAHFQHGLLRVELPKSVGPRRRLPINIHTEPDTDVPHLNA
ncbi:MAG: Hsp20/alpha crystallin family protein [Clostridia bacterium]